MPLSAGLYAALITPFTTDGTAIAEEVLAPMIDHVIGQGLDGFYVGGSTSEAFLQSAEEREQLLRAVAREAGGRCTLIAHVGDTDPRVGRRLARAAAEAGYDALSAVPPFYYPYTWPEIRAHYRELAALTELPFMMYNIPALSGVALSTAQISELLALPRVAGLKNTAADYFQLERICAANPDKLIFNGYDETLLAGLALGASGGIGSTYNVQGAKFRALADAFAAGEMSRARDIQADINALIEVMVAHGVYASLKYLLAREGIRVGPCRAPFAPLNADGRRALDAARERLLVA